MKNPAKGQMLTLACVLGVLVTLAEPAIGTLQVRFSNS